MYEIYKAYFAVLVNRLIKSILMTILGLYDNIGKYFKPQIKNNISENDEPVVTSIIYASINGQDCTAVMHYLLYEAHSEMNFFSVSTIRDKLNVSSTDELVLALSTDKNDIHTVKIHGKKWYIDGLEKSAPSFGIIPNALVKI